MSWFTRLLPSINLKNRKKDIPEGLWSKCDECQAILYQAELERHLMVCPKCQHHLYLPARKRLIHFLDKNGSVEIASDLETFDWLKFNDKRKYKDRLQAAYKKTREKSALVAMEGHLNKKGIVACAFEYAFIGGSMDAAVGEKFVQAVHVALEKEIPLICFSASGGARMQEGLVSLMQMAKVSAALAKLSEARIPYISVLTHPTTGGVSASLAMLGDIIVAEPKALIGFSGPRVIEQTIHQKLPEGFQRSEFLLEHGALDMIVHRHELRKKIIHLLEKLG